MNKTEIDGIRWYVSDGVVVFNGTTLTDCDLEAMLWSIEDEEDK